MFAEKSEYMSKIFNIIPGVESDAILLYGYIGNFEEVTPREIVTEVLQATYSGRDIDVRINSEGGEVDAGIAIFNALRNSTANINIYIDGVAASIAGVIAMCGKPVHMSRYARLMIHKVQGGKWGTADDLINTAAEITKLENNIAEIFSKKIGIPIEEVKATYFDGKDHWFTAEEALKIGFIDTIYDTDPIDVTMPPRQVYEYYMNKFKNQFNPDEEMNEVKKKLGLTDSATEAEVLNKINELEAASADTTQKDSTIAELTNQLQVYKQKDEEAETSAINALVDKAIAENKIQATQKEHFVNVLKANRASGEAILNSLTPFRKASKITNQNSSTEAGAWEKRQAEIEENSKKR